VWKALAVALVISACVDVLVPRQWLLRVLGRRTPLGGSIAGGPASLPGMMRTCCTGPLTAPCAGPEYLLAVVLVGLISEPLSHVLGAGGAIAVMVAAAVGTLLVLHTSGEVPIL
jgi:uncharacterized membrane protein YraQ (UPF0718 family)